MLSGGLESKNAGSLQAYRIISGNGEEVVRCQKKYGDTLRFKAQSSRSMNGSGDHRLRGLNDKKIIKSKKVLIPHFDEWLGRVIYLSNSANLLKRCINCIARFVFRLKQLASWDLFFIPSQRKTNQR